MQVIDLKYLLEKKQVSYYERLTDSTGHEHEVRLPPESQYISYRAYDVIDIEYIDNSCAKITIQQSEYLRNKRRGVSV